MKKKTRTGRAHDETARLPAEPVSRRQIVVLLVALAALTIAVYWQSVDFDFVNLDDNHYVYGNPTVLHGLTLDGLRYAFTFQALNWHPVTWLSLMADSQISEWLFSGGLSLGNERAGVFHATNVLLHAANATLLFLLLLSTTGRPFRSAFVAALFAVHPCHVESVAWVTERKDVLSTLFWLLGMLAYVRYVRKPRPGSYMLVAAVFALGLMSKPMLVTLPVVLLLTDLWPLERYRPRGTGRQASPRARNPQPFAPLLAEKLPLFAMTAASCVITVLAQRRGVVPFDILPLGVRAANAAVSTVHYILKMMWPAKLACLYPHPGEHIPTWMVVWSVVGLVAFTALAVRCARRAPYVTVGWLWYLCTLLPVSGLVQVGRQQMADRYTYIPFIGLFILIAWSMPEMAGSSSRSARRVGVIVLAAAAAVILALSAVSFRQAGLWRNSVLLMRHAIDVTNENYVAYNNLAQGLSEIQDYDGAFEAAVRAVEIDPNYVDGLFNLGTLYAINGDYNNAEKALARVIELKPNHSGAYNNLGRVAIARNRLDQAIEFFRAAVDRDPGNADARRNLDNALAEKQMQEGS